MSPHRCVMAWLVLSLHVILATESSFWELHLRLLDMLCAARGVEGEPLPISPSSFVTMMILSKLVEQSNALTKLPLPSFRLHLDLSMDKSSPLLASPSSLAAAVLHSGFAIQKPLNRRSVFQENERDLCLADRCYFCMNIFFLLTV